MDVLKRAGLSILEGKGITGLSLPIYIMEPRSTADRYADYFGAYPHWLNKAYGLKPIEKIKYALTAMVSGLPYSIGQLKPFNP